MTRHDRSGRSPLRRTIDALGLALCVLHHLQFDAPWKVSRSRC